MTDDQNRTLNTSSCDGQWCDTCPEHKCKMISVSKIDTLRTKILNTERDTK